MQYHAAPNAEPVYFVRSSTDHHVMLETLGEDDAWAYARKHDGFVTDPSGRLLPMPARWRFRERRGRGGKRRKQLNATLPAA